MVVRTHSTLLLAATALALSCGLNPADAQVPGGQTIASTKTGKSDVTQRPLKLDDSDFWLDPNRTRSEISRPLLRARQEALLFDAPSQVAIDARDTAPVQALRVATFDTLAARPFDRSAVVVAVDLDNNVVAANLAIRPSDREQAPAPAGNPPPAQPGMGGEAFTIDLRERLGLPWEPGRFLVRLMIADQLTDARTIEFIRNAAAVDPAVEAYRNRTREATNIPALTPEPRLPWAAYTRDGASLPLPAAAGISLEVPRVCVLDKEPTCLLKGSFRLPVLKRHIGAAPAAIGATPTIGVVPVTLVGVGSVSTGPAVWRLVLPVYEALTVDGSRSWGTGHFAIDMRRLQAFDGIEQTWVIYAFSDESVAGPVSIGLTRRPRTP